MNISDDDGMPAWLADKLGKAHIAPPQPEVPLLNFAVAADENLFSNAAAASEAATAVEEREKKTQFNNFVREQKTAEERGDVEGQIRALRGALLLRPGNDKVKRKLDKLVKQRTERLNKELERRDEEAAAAAEAAAATVSQTVATKEEVAAIKVDGFKHRPGSSTYQLPGGYKLPKDVFEKLFKYQREGVRWMWSLHRREAGGVLADEMGLGKTVQVAAFLRGLFASKQVETVLIVMPKSVVENWRKEIAHWTRRLVLTFEGTKNQRERILEQIAEQGGILLTTYGMIRTNAKKLTGLQNARTGVVEQWDYVILDEGHKIKNSSSEGAKSMKQIESPHKLVLTGTPILNQLLELWALYDYVQPGLLGDQKLFRREFDDPIVRASHKNAKPEHKQHGETMLQRLKQLIQPHFLRRVKEEVFSQRHEAPREEGDVAGAFDTDQKLMDKYRIKVRKNDLICWVSMSKVQLELYDKFLTLPEVKEIFNTSKSPLAAITVLKKICQHPRLLHANMKTLRETDPVTGLPAAATDALEGTVASLLAKMTAGEGDAAVVEQSGKLSFTLTLVDDLLRGGHRVLIFSQWQKMLDIIGASLAARSISYVRLDGTVNKTEDRQKLIDSFNKGGASNVFLLTTQVGGLGITLTGADRAIIYDPSWNCTDDQAVDRIYRIGQQRNCVIYRLITCGTVEEKIYRKQVFKGGLSRMVSATESVGSLGGDMGFRYFTKNELRALFTLENPFESVTQQQLHGKNAARRNTDSELDAHLQFLGTIGNFHGVSDHDLLFDEAGVEADAAAAKADVVVPSANVQIDEKENEREVEMESETVGTLVNDISVVLNDDDVNDRCLVMESRGRQREEEADEEGDRLDLRLKGMSLETPSPIAKKHRTAREVEVLSEEEEEEREAYVDSFVVSDDMELSYTQPEEKEEEEEPEIHYRGPRSTKKPAKLKLETIVSAAQKLEERGMTVEALDKYMDAHEVAEGRTKKQIGQKILLLRQQIASATRQERDDLELFDDDADVECESRGKSNGAVIDSPVAAPSVEHDSKQCVICLSSLKEMCFAPCGHMCCCASCADNPSLHRCPICRAEIVMKIKVFA